MVQNLILILDATNFSNADLSYTDWFGARDGYYAAHLNVGGPNLTGADLTGADLRGSNFSSINVHNAVFTDAKVNQFFWDNMSLEQREASTLYIPQVSIDGLNAEGQTLTVNLSGLEGLILEPDYSGNPSSFLNYQWYVDGSAVANTTDNYLLEESDVGKEISVEVDYHSGSVSANIPEPIQNVNDSPEGLPVIQGISEED